MNVQSKLSMNRARLAFALAAILAAGCGDKVQTPASPPGAGAPANVAPALPVVDVNLGAPAIPAVSPAPPAETYPSADEIAKLPPDGGPEFNRLIFEKSPYLLQHARNPVDWHPWGEAAFEKAKAENKLIFLSVGYSTCHWCHVMEDESFENQSVADLLNRDFVAIKVDREDRPDIDAAYMRVAVGLTGHGGWPMTMIMTPDKKPIHAGTYYPPESGGPRGIGLKDLLGQLANIWKDETPKALDIASKIEAEILKASAAQAGEALGPEILTQAYDRLAQIYDKANGGFGMAPKFPTPHNVMFLLRHWRRTGDPQALEMAERTLLKMRLGGIYDHIGLGFHRYATDPEWLIPHWEKMIYDQAMIATACIEAHQAIGKPFMAETAREIFTYMTRDMASPQGAFYGAEDADSEGEEGKFYRWTTAEVRRALGQKNGDLFVLIFGLSDAGNYVNPLTGKQDGTNILYLAKPAEEIAADLKIDQLGDLKKWIETMRGALLKARGARVRPFQDDKVLADWNGLAIASLAFGGATLFEDRWTSAAAKAADFVMTNMREADGRLRHRWRGGEAALPAHLEDYAYMTWGLIELYQATFDVKWLRQAIELNGLAVKHFWDAENGGFYQTADDGEKLLMRLKDAYDGATPSGNSVAAMNLLRLAKFTGDGELARKADALFKAFGAEIKRSPSAYTQMLAALDFAIGPSQEFVIAAKDRDEDFLVMSLGTRIKFLPNKIMMLREETDPPPPITEIAPFTKEMKMIDGKTTMYICENFACKEPINDVKKARATLATMSKPLNAQKAETKAEAKAEAGPAPAAADENAGPVKP